MTADGKPLEQRTATTFPARGSATAPAVRVLPLLISLVCHGGGMPVGGFVTRARDVALFQEGRCKATWKREFQLPWREAGPLNHHEDLEDSDQEVFNQKVSLCMCRH